MRRFATISLALLLAGCATTGPGGVEIPAPFTKPADTVQYQRGKAFRAYSGMRVAYAKLSVRVDIACEAGRLDASWCAGDFPRLKEESERVDARIMESLENPAVEIDWKAIYEAVELVVKLAGKAL